METNKGRSLHEVNEILHLAKYSEEEVVPLSQVIYFTEENFYNNSFKLIQIDDHLTDEIKEGKTLYIKGADDEDAVICSDTKTYNLVTAETSNSLLLVKNLTYNNEAKEVEKRSLKRIDVAGIFYEYLEINLGKPHLRKLQQILKSTIFKGNEYEFEIDQEKLYSFDELDKIIQASRKELKEALDALDAVEINGKIRLLDFQYHFRVLSYMLDLINENSWDLDSIDYEVTMESLSGLVPTEVLNALFDRYTEESQIIDGLQLYRYKEEKVCMTIGKAILQTANKFPVDEFFPTWQDSVPVGMTVSEEMIYGIAVIDRKSTPNYIRAFDEGNLPENITDRLQVLFNIKDKWSVPEIAPYIKSLTTEKLDVNALLAKYARASNEGGVKYYSAKHNN